MRLPRRMFGLLAGDVRGATLPEFAFVMPVFLIMLFGIFDTGQSIYVNSVLNGAVQDAGRDAGLESGGDKEALIDQYVKDQLGPIAITNPTYEITRENYYTFADVGRPEDFTDKNKNNVYDANECFTDENASGKWEGDVSKDGLGGANDVVLFTVKVSYDRVFPIWTLIGGSQRTEVTAKTILRNQPFGKQAARVKSNICPKP